MTVMGASCRSKSLTWRRFREIPKLKCCGECMDWMTGIMVLCWRIIVSWYRICRYSNLKGQYAMWYPNVDMFISFLKGHWKLYLKMSLFHIKSEVDLFYWKDWRTPSKYRRLLDDSALFNLIIKQSQSLQSISKVHQNLITAINNKVTW